jgi:tetratricopeptide (TPR) repeat protein
MPPLAEGFSPRLESVPDLEATLMSGVTVVLVPARSGPAPAVTGPGGADDRAGPADWQAPYGKTQLAVYCAESLWRARVIDLLIWINASSRVNVLSGYMRAATAMGADADADTEATASHLVGWLARATRPWLVVLDGLDTRADLDGLWPGGPEGRLLVTTSDAAALIGDRHAAIFQIPPLSSREATALVAGRLTTNPDQRNGAIDLVQDLGGEPLALGQAAAVIASSGLACRDYRQYYSEWRTHLAPHGGPSSSVTWALSAAYAEQLVPGARGVLTVTAFLDGDAIPGTVFTTLALGKFLAGDGSAQSPDPERAWTAVRALEQAGLVTIDASTPPTVRMSGQVQRAIRAQLPAELTERTIRAAADALLEVWPKDTPQSPLAADMRSSVSHLWRIAADSLWADGRCHPVLMLAGQSLDGAHLAGASVVFWRDIVATCERILGPAGPDTAIAAGRLADALITAGQPGEAVTWYQWVLTGRVGLLGPDHPGTIAARSTLGRALIAAGRSADAVSVLSEVAAESERVHGPDHMDTLIARDECAAACLAAGNTALAIRMYRRSLADRERLHGPRHPDTLAASMRLADAYLSGGEHKEAIAQGKRILGDREQVLGADHPDTLGVRRRLAEIYRAAGKVGNALQQYEQTCAGLIRALGPDNRETLACQAELARVYYNAGRFSDAVTLLTEAAARAEQALPPGDTITRDIRQALAEITG